MLLHVLLTLSSWIRILDLTPQNVEVDLFAMELLVPDETFLEYQEYTTEQIGTRSGYTEKLIKLRLKSK